MTVCHHSVLTRWHNASCLSFIVAAAWVLRARLMIVHIEGESMTPSLSDGDRVLAVRRAPWRRVRRGEIVVCRRPGGRGPYLIKRVTAVAGDVEPVRTECACARERSGKLLGAGELWLRGDAGRGFDSQYFGSLSESNVVARVVARLNSPSQPSSPRLSTSTRRANRPAASELWKRS